MPTASTGGGIIEGLVAGAAVGAVYVAFVSDPFCLGVTKMVQRCYYKSVFGWHVAELTANALSVTIGLVAGGLLGLVAERTSMGA